MEIDGQGPRIFFFNYFLALLLAVLGLCCCVGFSLAAASGGCSSLHCTGFLLAVASSVAEHRLPGTELQ